MYTHAAVVVVVKYKCRFNNNDWKQEKIVPDWTIPAPREHTENIFLSSTLYEQLKHDAVLLSSWEHLKMLTEI